ncbi:MAG TPA: oligopeptide/dipeptide ABC transporter ATP-binding protein [Acetobacteraceae bacterium]|nr:oligopeptide/dipeptide ABC transporter ATP-binding protein [Acetobacteraceae bacterium]
MIALETVDVAYTAQGRSVPVVHGVSLALARGEVLGLVGESGSGKTTIGRTALRLLKPVSGRVMLDGQDITGLPRRALRPLRRRLQMIFQDPYSSLDPRLTVARIIGEACAIHNIGTRRDRAERVAHMLQSVGLAADAMHRFPHEFSGGQRQRISIARALIAEPHYLVADEPVSALDVSVQAQVINLLRRQQREMSLGLLFISHDLAVVRHVCDRVLVLYLGRVMESAPVSRLFSAPRHPYTAALLAAAPRPDPDRRGGATVLEGEIPRPDAPPGGCVFRTRCPYALADCSKTVPPLVEVAPGHSKACIRDDVP